MELLYEIVVDLPVVVQGEDVAAVLGGQYYWFRGKWASRVAFGGLFISECRKRERRIVEDITADIFGDD